MSGFSVLLLILKLHVHSLIAHGQQLRDLFRVFFFSLFKGKPDVFCMQKLLVKPNLSFNFSYCALCTKDGSKERISMEFLSKMCTAGNQL